MKSTNSSKNPPNTPSTSAFSTHSFNSSQLIRLLADLAAADVANAADSQQTFAEKLGLWLDWTDAIALSAAINGGSAGPATRPAEGPSGAPFPAKAALDEFTRVRADLAKAITTDAVFKASKASAKPAQPEPGRPPDDTADFSPYRRQYLAHQRAMEASVGPLRSNVRAALASLSPALGQLAALDAALDKALTARERQGLSTVPVLLEKYFKRLCNAPPAAAITPGPTPPGPESAQPSWLAGYCKNMQGVLLAELDIRLHPVEGMLEAILKSSAI